MVKEVPVDSVRLHGPSTHLEVSALAATDPSQSPTEAWLVKAGRWITTVNFALTASHGILLPILMLPAQWYFNYWLTYGEFAWLILLGYGKLIVTFTILHRFFAHKTFSTSRPMAFLLGLIALTGDQKGPLWWAGKHVRHHKFCENEGDPHSVQRFGWIYGYIGWTAHPFEWEIDWAFVHEEFKTWEMVLCEALAGVVPWAEQAIIYHFFGLKAALMSFWATVAAVHFTLFFNVYLHHDDDVDPAPMPETGKYRCRAHDKLPRVAKVVFDLIGEMDHFDHHRFPRKALHPSLMVDVPYWSLIWPGEQLGLFYDVNHDGKQLTRRKRRSD